jgi:hypothetical protein
MSDLSANDPQSVPPPPAVLEYRRVEPVIRHLSDRTRRNIIGGSITVMLLIAFLAAMICQWNYPSDERARNTNRWFENELERRIYERDHRKGIASGNPPAAASTVNVHAWASVAMTVVDAALLLLALFSHRLVRRSDEGIRPSGLTPRRIWNAMLSLAAIQLLLALACVGNDAWRIFTGDFVMIGWVLVALLTIEFVTRISTRASFPEVLQRLSFAAVTERPLLR